MWTYTDVYQALVDYVMQNMKEGNYKLNWGIVAIAANTPRVIVRFTLKNVCTNRSKMWTTVLVGETIAHLTAHAKEQVERYMDELQ